MKKLNEDNDLPRDILAHIAARVFLEKIPDVYRNDMDIGIGCVTWSDKKIETLYAFIEILRMEGFVIEQTSSTTWVASFPAENEIDRSHGIVLRYELSIQEADNRNRGYCSVFYVRE